MATFTITTPTYITALTGKTGGDVYNINGGSLIIDCDSRYGPNTTGLTGSLGNVTVDSALGGSLKITTEFTRLIQFTGGSGTVPTYGTIITQGAASAVLLCVMELEMGGDLSVAGAAMPATGWLKVRLTSGTFAAGALTGINATSAGADKQGWITVVGNNSGTHSHPRLGSLEMRGDWIECGITNGIAGQFLKLPRITAEDFIYYPGVDVETAPGSGVYQFWPNAGTRHTTTNSSTDSRSMFCYIDEYGFVWFGESAANATCGAVPPAGCKVRIPSIILQNCLTTARNVNVEPNRTMGTRYESTFSNAGVMNVSKVTGAWYWNVVQPYSVYIRDLHVCDSIIIGECATAMDIDNLHVGLSTSATDFGSNAIVLQQSYNGGTVGTMSWLRSTATTTSSYAAIFVNLYGGWTFNKLRGGHIGQASTLSGAIYVSTNGPMVINELWTFAKRVLVQAAENLKINRHVYADSNVGTTNTTAQSRAIETVGQCATVDITNIENWPGVANCHPYLALLYCNTTKKLKLRNCGTAAVPYNAGTVNQMGYIWDDGGNNDTIKLQRNWTTQLRLGLHGGTNTTKNFTSVNNYQVDASRTIGPQQLDSVTHGNRWNSGGVPNSYSSVYGNCMWDGFTGDTTTRAALILVEKSAANPDAYQITAGAPKFTGAGRAVFPVAGNQITWTWPWRILGWTGLNSMAVSGANTANHLCEYSLDKLGSGYSAWKTLTNANLAAETGIDPIVGFGLKIRITATVTNTGNRIDAININGLTTLAAQNVALYPLDVSYLALTGLQTGSTVAVFSGIPAPGQVPLTLLENSTTVANMSYDYDPGQTTCTVRIRKPGFAPIDLTYTNAIEVGFPVSQVENKDGFGDAIYGRGTGTTTAFVTPDGPSLRIDIGNQLCAAEDVYDVVADWQATPTGMLYPEAIRFDGRDMLLIGSWRLRRALAAYTNSGIDSAVIVDGMVTASPDDEVNGSVDIRAKAVRTFTTSAGSLTPSDIALISAGVWAHTLSTGNPAESELLSAKNNATNAFIMSV